MLYAFAISAKLSIVTLPFVFLYLYNNKSVRIFSAQFFTGFGLIFSIFGVAFIFSESAVFMLMSNPEMSDVLSLSLTLGQGAFVYIVPVLFFSMLYYAWRVRRLNFQLFTAVVGVIFLMIVILMPTVPGWFVWTVPFLVFYQAISDKTSIVITTIFASLFVLSTAVKESFFLSNGSVVDISAMVEEVELLSSAVVVSVLDTGLFAVGVVLALRMWREAITNNEFFKQSREPFVVGIAGDSGAGKDTFSDSLVGLFGKHSSTAISGDDYHLWDRHKPMWQVMTHLNPVANDLEKFSGDVLALAGGRTIQTRAYDHTSGKMSKKFFTQSNDFIFASGLHALYLPALRECYQLAIYLDIHEGLRRHFKIRRDVGERGHSLERVLTSLEAREPDSIRFIKPQRSHADLVLSLCPMHDGALSDSNFDIDRQLKVIAFSKSGIDELKLNRVLVGLCGLHVDVAKDSNSSVISMTIEGDISCEDIAMAANVLCPNMFQFFDISPTWEDGPLGVMQLIAITHINQILTKRFLR